jgi:hypothetical protein
VLANITVGDDGKPPLLYDFEGPKGKLRNPPGEWVAGSCVGSSAGEIFNQFKPIYALRPECKKPVWRCSLNMHTTDGQLTASEWDVVSRRFLVLMGIDPYKAAWCAIQHRDKPSHDHTHITVSRVLPDGSLWDRAHDAKRAMEACTEIERESMQLIGRQLHQHDRTPAQKRSLTMGERKMIEKGHPVIREIITKKVDDVLKAHPAGIGLTDFVAEMKKAGVEARPYLPKGEFKGMSYSAQGVSWPGSKLGTAYTNVGLIERGVRHLTIVETPISIHANLITGVCPEQHRDKWWYRNRVDIVRMKFGLYSREYESAVAGLADVGFNSHDEEVYQAWVENSSDVRLSSDQPNEEFLQDLYEEYGLARDPDICS